MYEKNNKKQQFKGHVMEAPDPQLLQGQVLLQGLKRGLIVAKKLAVNDFWLVVKDLKNWLVHHCTFVWYFLVPGLSHLSQIASRFNLARIMFQLGKYTPTLP